MPTREQVEKAIELMGKSFANYVYFFTQLDDPAWLVPLRERGLFDNPPPAQSGQRWPQVEYLSKMTRTGGRETQTTVLDIILSIKTDNEYLYWSIAECMLAMPPDLAAKWTEVAIQWMGDSKMLLGMLPETLGNLASSLAKGGYSDLALLLATKLLAVLRHPDDEKEPKTQAEEIMLASFEPGIRCDRYHYERVLERNIPDLVRIAPFQTLNLLCDILATANNYSQRRGEARKPNDFSYIWRAAIEDHDQNRTFSIRDPLITAVRDASELICKEWPDKTPEVVACLEKREWDIFRRIVLHLLRVLPAIPPDQIERRLTDYELFEKPSFRHEYFHLAEERFGFISSVGQNTILRWIMDAKDLKEYLAKQKEGWTQEQKERRTRYWQYERLWPLRSYLAEPVASQFEQLRRAFGEPEHPSFTSYVSTWMGNPESPKSLQDFELMTVSEIVTFLSEWKPTGKWRDPTPDSLGLVLRAVVTGKPEKFTAEIDKFIGRNLDPTYIRNLIAGFNQATSKGVRVDHNAVFKLCGWVVGREPTIPGREVPQGLREGLEIDLDWNASRREIADLLEKVFNEEIGLPSDFRSTVWDLIEPLTRDPEPDLEYEAKYGGKNMDPLTLSINTIRGKALHSVMNYALWLCRDVKAREKRRPSFADMPEVRAVLEDHLDINRDRTQTSRAVYGQWISRLGYMDKDWVQANLDKIFPAKDGLRPLRNAAWHTYLMYSDSIVFDLLGDIYKQEVAGLAGKEVGGDEYRSPETRLAEHLMILCSSGCLGLEKDGLLDVFFRTAHHTLTAKALDSIGRDFQWQKEIPPEIVERFKTLWDWRLKMAGGIDKTPKDDLAAFGWWFSSGKCGDAWAYERLERVLERTDIPRPNMFAFDYMAKVFKDYPKQSLRCLRLFVDRNKDQWFFGAKKEAVWNILEAALSMGDPEIKRSAEDIVHLLGSKGYFQYRELLGKK